MMEAQQILMSEADMAEPARQSDEYGQHYGNDTASASHHESVYQNLSDGPGTASDFDEDQQHYVAAPAAQQDWQPVDGSDDNIDVLENVQQTRAQDNDVQQAGLDSDGGVNRCPDHVASNQGRHPFKAPQFQDYDALHRATIGEQEEIEQGPNQSEREIQQVLTRPHTKPSPNRQILNSRGVFEQHSWISVPQSRADDPSATVIIRSSLPARPHSEHVPLASEAVDGQDEQQQQAHEANSDVASSEVQYHPTDATLVDSGAEPTYHNDVAHCRESSPPLFSRSHRDVFQPSFRRSSNKLLQQVPCQSYKSNPAPQLAVSSVVQTRTLREAPAAQYGSQTTYDHGQTALVDSMGSDRSALTAAMHHVVQIAQHQAKTLSDEHEAERKSLSSKLDQALSTKQALADQIEVIQSEKHELRKLVDKQVYRLSAFEAKAGRFKVFVHGLGNDLDALKRDSQTQRQTAEQLVSDSNQRRATQEMLLHQVAACHEKSVQLKSDAIKTAQGFQTSLSHATVRLKYLESELQAKIQLLAEEKEITLRLQQQLETAGANNDSVTREIKSNGNAILDKLFEMHAEMDQHFKNQQVTEMVEKMAAAVQGLNSQQAATAGEIASVKSLVESCTESMHNQPTTMNDQGNGSDLALKTQLDDALKSLKADLCNQEELIAQDITNRETISGLRQKLQSSAALVSQQAVELNSSQKSEAELKQHCAVIQAQVVSLSTEQARSNETQLNQTNAELQLKTSELEAAWAEIATKERDLHKLIEDKTRLDAEVQSLQQGLETILASAPTFDDERHRLEKEHAAKLDSLRKEMSRHANDFKAAEHARVENEVRKVANERDKLVEKIQSLEGTLAAVEDQVSVTRTSQQELSGLRQQLESADREINSLRSQKEELRIAVDTNNSAQEEYAALNARYSAQQQQLQLVVGEKTTLDKRIERLTHAESKLHQQLKESYETKKDFEAASKAKLVLEEERHKKNLDALQKRLVEAESECRRKEEELSHYKSQNEASWTAQEDQHREELAMANKRATQAMSRENEIFADNERLRIELAARVQQQPRESQANLLISAPASVDDPGGSKGTKPRRKIVDRRRPSEMRVALADSGYGRQSPFPTSQSCSNRQDDFFLRGPEIEESQQQEILVADSQPQGGVHVVGSKQQIAADLPGGLDAVSSPVSLTHSQHQQQYLGLADTQDSQSQTGAFGSLLEDKAGFGDSLPSFSQFNLDHSNLPSKSQGRDFDVLVDRSDAPSDSTPYPSNSLRDSVGRSGINDSALQSLMPPPNSSMKRVRSGSVDPRASLSRESSTAANKPASNSAERFAKTPEPQSMSFPGGRGLEQAQESPYRSSSPAFMANATARSGQKLQDLNSAMKRKPFEATVSSHPKRKASSGINEGFEHERKRHSTRASSLRSGPQPQIKGKSGRGMPSSQSSDATATAPVRPQTPAPKRGGAGTSRATRGQKKMSKNDEMNARFQREMV